MMALPLRLSLAALCLLAAGCDDPDDLDGPMDQGPTLPAATLGDASLGRDVFRFETFGNERFFTRAVRLPQGMRSAHTTPRQLLSLGVSIDADMLPAAVREGFAASSAAVLDDSLMTMTILDANAVIGMPVKDSNGDGRLSVADGDLVGTTCTLCHARADDGAIFQVAGGGSVGRRQDGLAAHNLNFGRLMALGTNTRALYPILQLALTANGGATIGRAPTGLTETSSEADVDAYLSNPAYYPVGMFDDTFDGNGDPQHNSVLFRQDLAAPFGTDGTIARLDNFNNLVYTGLLDPTVLTTPGGREFLNKLGGPAGDEIADDYVQILAETGVTGYPFIDAAPSAAAGMEEAPLGVRVSDDKLFAMNAYLFGLEAPPGQGSDSGGRGAALFSSVGCTSCHNADQRRPVPTFVVPMARIFPGDMPVLLAQRTPPLNPVLNTLASIYDDKVAIVNASIRGDIRGSVLPLLLDLASKPAYLHDNSVPSLDNLMDSARGATAPHPFYVVSRAERDAIAAFLRSLSTRG